MSTGDQEQIADSAEEYRDSIVTIEEIVDELNYIEAFLNDISGQDEYLEAVLENQRIQLLLALQQAVFSGGIPPGDTDPATLGDIPLPINSIGIMARDIIEGDDGYAVFFLNGGRFRAEIVAEEDLEAGEPIVVVGGGNRAEAANESGSVSGLFSEAEPGVYTYNGEIRSVPSVVLPEDDIKVENQIYTNGEYNTVESDLAPGQEKRFARINVAPDEFLLLKYTYATAGDTLRYNYYIDGSNTPDPDLSGVTPLGTPGDPKELVKDGFILIEDSVELVIEETSGNTSYDKITGALEGVLREE